MHHFNPAKQTSRSISRRFVSPGSDTDTPPTRARSHRNNCSQASRYFPAASSTAALDRDVSQAMCGPMLYAASLKAASTLIGSPGLHESTVDMTSIISLVSKALHSGTVRKSPIFTPAVLPKQIVGKPTGSRYAHWRKPSAGTANAVAIASAAALRCADVMPITLLHPQTPQQ